MTIIVTSRAHRLVRQCVPALFSHVPFFDRPQAREPQARSAYFSNLKSHLLISWRVTFHRRYYHCGGIFMKTAPVSPTPFCHYVTAYARSTRKRDNESERAFSRVQQMQSRARAPAFVKEIAYDITVCRRAVRRKKCCFCERRTNCREVMEKFISGRCYYDFIFSLFYECIWC